VTGHDASRLAPLPIRPRPAAGEPVSSYVRRLARANHLRPSYLHGYLAGPPDYLRAISPQRLAVLSGRTAAVLERTLTGLTRPGRDTPGQPSGRVQATGQPNGLGASIGLGITNFLVPAIGFAFIQATWGRYTAARTLLALSGHLPWRLTAFLQDAAVNRGVLRQFGAVYQFRHVELQRRLATPVSQATSDPVVEGSVT